MKKKALIVGSLSYDVIFSIHGNIQDEILIKEGELGKVNMMFTANGRQRYYGGTAGNIAYGLGLLGASPLLFSSVGKDFNDEYRKHLEDLGVEVRVLEKKDQLTATFYAISDEDYQQIGIWQPDAYDGIEKQEVGSVINDKELSNIEVAIFSPGTGKSTRNHMLEIRKKLGDKVTVIFDPSQVLSIFYDEHLLKECLTLADIVISNETEIDQFEKLFKISQKDVLGYGVETIIETLGEKGVNIITKDETFHVEPKKPRKVTETTGAGDAFRSGLIYGILNNFSVKKACMAGAFMGSKSVEEMGGQMYFTDKDELEECINSK